MRARLGKVARCPLSVWSATIFGLPWSGSGRGEVLALRSRLGDSTAWRPRLVAVIALALLVAGAGCASSCPRYDNGNWRELSTRNFRLRTDLDESDARDMVTELETARAALLTTFGAPTDTATGQVSVLVLDDGWGVAAGSRWPGFFTRALFTPYIMIQAGSGLAGQTVVKHELVHQLSHFVRPREPAWLAEGLAGYFETMEIADDKRMVTVGRPWPRVVSKMQGIGMLSVDELRAGAAVHDPRSVFYPSAWLMVHYLMNHRREGLRSYQRELGHSANESHAWAVGFGDLTPEQLDFQLRRYVDGGRYFVFNYPLAPLETRITDSRPLTVADAGATRALLYALMSKAATGAADFMPRSREELELCARQELAEVARSDAEHTQALAVKAWELGDQIELGAAQRGVERNPQDWMAWWLLATTLHAQRITDDRFIQAVDKANALVAGNPAIELKAPARRR
jgi:hypothetical protein